LWIRFWACAPRWAMKCTHLLFVNVFYCENYMLTFWYRA
jgi:hypothetical protein